MVGPAQQGQVGKVGGAAVEPVAQVVGLAPGQGALAAGEDTAAVADGQGSSLGGRDDPAAAADLQRLAGGAAQDAGAAVADEAVQVHRHQQLGPHPTTLGQPATLQGAAGQLAQGIGPPLAAVANVVGVGRAGQGFQGGQQGLAGFGLQQAIDRDHAVQGG